MTRSRDASSSKTSSALPPSTVELLRNAQAGPNVYPGVPAEFTNWRDEQRAWQQTCVLFDQSFHMAELAVEGRDALALLSGLGVNSFDGFAPGKAKHFVPCTPEGYVIGDVILFALAEDTFNLVGRAPALNWVTYHAETGGYDVSVELDQRSALRTDGRRKHYRFQVQGPNAMQVIEKVLGAATARAEVLQPHRRDDRRQGPSARFATGWSASRAGSCSGPGRTARPSSKRCSTPARSSACARPAGARTRPTRSSRAGSHLRCRPSTRATASKAYREWLPATGYEANASIGGSFVSDDIEDYYFTPWDLGYGSYVKFDHDFIGREALEAMADDDHRRKVTLALDDEDVTRTIGTMFQATDRAKFMDWPSAVYSMHPYDRVTVDGETVGVSTWIGYSANEGKMLTLAVLDAEHAEPGGEVTLVWGEEDGGTAKPTVEPHVQTELRAVVSPAPYVETVRTDVPPSARREALGLDGLGAARRGSSR